MKEKQLQDFERELSASRAETESERGRLNAVINRLETTLVQQGSEVSCICLMPSLVKYSTVNKESGTSKILSTFIQDTEAHCICRQFGGKTEVVAF